MARKYSRYKKLLPFPVMEGGGTIPAMVPKNTGLVNIPKSPMNISSVDNGAFPTSIGSGMDLGGAALQVGAALNPGSAPDGNATGNTINALLDTAVSTTPIGAAALTGSKYMSQISDNNPEDMFTSQLMGILNPYDTLQTGVNKAAEGDATGYLDILAATNPVTAPIAESFNTKKARKLKEEEDQNILNLKNEEMFKMEKTLNPGRYQDTNQMMMAAYGGQLPDGEGTDYFRTDKNAYVDSVVDARKDVGWLQRATLRNGPSIPTPKDVPGYKPGMTSTHLLSDDGKGYVYPRIVEKDGKLVDLGIEAQKYARETNTGIQFPQEQGSWFAADGYKEGTNILKDYAYGGPMQPQGQPMQNMQQLGQPQGGGQHQMPDGSMMADSEMQQGRPNMKPQITDYSGATHDSPSGGIPVDSQGNPVAVSGGKPVALTESGEVAFKTKSGETYIFSEKIFI